MLAANVIPVGLPPSVERYQPSDDDQPDGAAGHRPGPLPVAELLGAVANEPDPQHEDEDGDDRPRRKPQDGVKGRRAGRRWRTRTPEGSIRTGCRIPTLAALAPIANPSKTTHAPSAPSPSRYHELPGASAAEDHAHSEDESAGDVGKPAERPDRDRFDQAELERVDADDRDQERENVGAQDRRVAHEDPVGERPGQAEAAALRAVAEEQAREERAAHRHDARELHGAILVAPHR